MADNVAITAGSGVTIAADDIGGVQYQRVKISQGADGSATDVSSAAPLQVSLANHAANATAVKVDGSAVTQPVSGSLTTVSTVTNVSQLGGAAVPIGAGTEAAAIRVTLPTNGTGIVGLAAGTNNIGDVDILSIAAGDNNIGNVDIVSVPAPLSTTGGGTEATALRVTVASDSTGVLSVDDNGGALTVDNAGTFAVQATVAAAATNIAKAEDTAHTTADVGVPALAVRRDTAAVGSDTDGDYSTLNVNSSGRLYTSATIDAALPAGTNAIGKLAANSGVDIGDVDITSIAAGDNNIGNVDIVSGTITTVSTLTGGGVAHDSADSGNPVKVGAKASATLSDDTMVASGDRTDLTSDLDGALLVRNQFPLGDLLSERLSNTDGASTASTVFGATASTRNVITTIVVHNAHASTNGYIDFRDGTAGSILYTLPLPANGGTVVSSDLGLFRTTANTALAIDVSAAITTVYVSMTGFKSKV